VSDNDRSWMDHRDELFERVVQHGRARKRRRTLVVTGSALALLIALAVGLIVPTHRTSLVRVAGRGSDHTSTTFHARASKGVLLVGDEVMLGAANAIERSIPGARIDAAVSRQFDQGASLLERDKRDGALPPTIVVHLGANGPFTAGAFDGLMRAAGPDSTVLFLTVKVPRAWEHAVNDALRGGALRWPNARVLDWKHYSDSHADWFTVDGFHLDTVGQTAYAAFIRHALSGPEPTTVAPARTTTPSVASALSTFLADHPDVVVHTDPFAYRDASVAVVGLERGGHDRALGIVLIADGVARQIASLTLPFPYFDFSREVPNVADLTGDGTPDALLHFEAADNSPGVVVSGDGGGWRLVPESSDPADTYIGPDPTINDGQLITARNDCVPNCAEGHFTTVTWHYDATHRVLVSG
jgi:hypothetical protein